MVELEQNVADRTIAANRSRESNSSLMNATIPLLLALSVAPQQGLAVSEVIVHQDASQATNESGIVSYWVSEAQLTQAMNNVIHQLLNEQVDLDADAKSALYKNRWELYD